MKDRVSIGQKFGRWIVIGRAPSTKDHRRWLCRCDCGTERIVWQQSLLNEAPRKNSRSCGCLHRETVSRTATTHGAHRTAEYRIWASMLNRCKNPKHKRYEGRGIAVCERWQRFENFLADMGERPSSKHTIERKNNDGNYEPANCRWATRTEQMRNTERARRITWRGETLSVYDWSERIGVKAQTLVTRIRRGWPIERAMTTL